MKPRIESPLAICLACLAVATAGIQDASAQGQPNTNNSRTAGLRVYSHVTGPNAATPGGIQLSVYGPPGSKYWIYTDQDPNSLDYTAPFAGVVGNTALASPLLLPLSLFTVPTGQIAGQIGPDGVQTLTSTFTLSPTSIFPGFWQALVRTNSGTPMNPAGTYYSTNPQSRIPSQQIAVPSATGFTRGGTAPGLPNIIADVEQADVDMDGDLDTLVLYQNGVAQLYDTDHAGPTVPTPAVGEFSKSYGTVAALPFPALATTNTAEFADLDDDGFPDLIVGGIGNVPGNYISVYRNLGSVAPGLFTPVPQSSLLLQSINASVNDIETADTDGDGDLDIGVATGSQPCFGEINLHIRNDTTPTGGLLLTDVTTTTMPQQAEDTEDMEFLDYDRDGDMDMVMGNFDGPTGIEGQNFVYTNNGFGNFQAAPIPVGTPSETLDVVAEDIDLDGWPDLYFANWLSNVSCGQPYTAFASDQLLLNSNGAFVQTTGLLPDSATYPQNAPFTPLPPWAATDAEATRMPIDNVKAGILTPKDYDHDGDVDIIIALGSGGITQPVVGGPTPATAAIPTQTRGVLILQNQQVQGGVLQAGLTPFIIDFSVFAASAVAPAADYRDIELGDWFMFNPPSGALIDAMQWCDKDIGAGTIDQGHFVIKKNNG